VAANYTLELLSSTAPSYNLSAVNLIKINHNRNAVADEENHGIDVLMWKLYGWSRSSNPALHFAMSKIYRECNYIKPNNFLISQGN